MIDMAKKEEKDIKSRVLSKTIQGIAGIVGESQTVIMGDGEGWNHVFVNVGTGFHLVYNVQTIDLSGYKLQDMTIFPQGVLMQDMQVFPQGAGVANLQRATMVSTTPINEGDLTNVDATQGNSWHLPGSLSSTHELANILQGRLQYYLTLTTYGGLQQTSESMWGTADSTAAEKIWCVEAILFPDVEGATFAAPDQAFVLPSIIAHEPELEYMMRLMRSVEPVY
jgi:hypothetical protein